MSPRRRRNSTGNDDDYSPAETPVNGESPKKKRRTSKRTSAPPQALDPSEWRQSKVPKDSLIKKKDATDLYRLKPSDLEGLTFTPYETKYVNDAHMYNEREVERKAWEKYGGPEGFEQHLAKLRKTWIKRQKPGSFKDFPQPSAYAPTVSQGHVSIGFLPAGLRDEDPYTTNASLRQLKREFPAAWLWTSCNKALGDPRDVHYAETYYTPSNERLDALRKFLNNCRGYPPRPQAPLPPSQSIDQLRRVLDDAPRRPTLEGSSSDDPRLEFHFDGFTGDSWHSWAVPYLTELFDALNAVIDEHGLGDAGWKTIRWEVYDKYSDAMGGISCARYLNEGHVWSDDAYEWLDGKCGENSCGSTNRELCESGRLYNNKLSDIGPIQ